MARNERNKPDENWHQAVVYSSIGVQLAASVVIGAVIGYYLDIRFGTEPWLMVAGIFLGAASGFYYIFKTFIMNEPKD